MFVTNSFLFHKTLRLAAGGGAYAFTGVPVDIRRLNALSLVRRTCTLAGQSAALRRASRVGVGASTLAASGQAAHLKRQLKLYVSASSISITGQSAALQKSRVSGFVKTEYEIAGQAVGLKRQRQLAATGASLSANLQSVGLLKVAGQIDVISADAALTSLDVQMVMARKLASSLATLAIATQQVNLRKNYPVGAQTAAFALTGVSVGMRAAKRLSVVKTGFACATPAANLNPSVRRAWTDSEAQSLADISTATFTGKSLGATTPTRYVVVMVSARGTGGANRTIIGITIGGVAASLLVASASTSNPTAIFGLLVASGTTTNIVVTASGVMSRCSIGIGTVDRYQSSTPTDTDSTIATGASVARPLDIAAGGVGFWCVSTAAVGDITWANANEQYDLAPATVFRGSAATWDDVAGSTRTATASWSGSQAASMCAVSFR